MACNDYRLSHISFACFVILGTIGSYSFASFPAASHILVAAIFKLYLFLKIYETSL